jgi:hypothetical protein
MGLDRPCLRGTPPGCAFRPVLVCVALICRALRRGRLICHLCALLALAVASHARADSEGYIDNWAGDIKIELATLGASGQPATFPIPTSNDVEPLRGFITERWGNRTNLIKVCDKIHDRFERVAQFTKWLSCEVAQAGELRGRISSKNTLDLKYVVTGNRVRFKKPAPSPFGAGFDPTIQADFDIVLLLTITFEGSVDGRHIPKSFESPPVPPSPPDPPGAIYLLHPAEVTIAQVTFSGAKFSFSEAVLGESVLFDLFGGESQLRAAERTMNATSDDLPAELHDLGKMNRAVNAGANRLADLIHSLQPALGTPSPLFDLAVSINPERSLVVQYKRFGNPPQTLPGCHCDEKCDNQVTCGCAGAGVIVEGERVFLQRLKPDGTWVPIGVSSASSDFVDGSALGAHTGDTLTHRICRLNQFGSSCTAPFGFVYRDIGACGPPGGGITTTGTPHVCHPCLQ